MVSLPPIPRWVSYIAAGIWLALLVLAALVGGRSGFSSRLTVLLLATIAPVAFATAGGALVVQRWQRKEWERRTRSIVGDLVNDSLDELERLAVIIYEVVARSLPENQRWRLGWLDTAFRLPIGETQKKSMREARAVTLGVFTAMTAALLSASEVEKSADAACDKLRQQSEDKRTQDENRRYGWPPGQPTTPPRHEAQAHKDPLAKDFSTTTSGDAPTGPPSSLEHALAEAQVTLSSANRTASEFQDAWSAAFWVRQSLVKTDGLLAALDEAYRVRWRAPAHGIELLPIHMSEASNELLDVVDNTIAKFHSDDAELFDDADREDRGGEGADTDSSLAGDEPRSESLDGNLSFVIEPSEEMARCINSLRSAAVKPVNDLMAKLYGLVLELSSYASASSLKLVSTAVELRSTVGEAPSSHYPDKPESSEETDQN
jgi:hypothetical protein